MAAHPRSRGENRSDQVGPVRSNGSSPLTRGKLASSPRCRSPTRLIPAHAGKTSYPHLVTLSSRAHPRSRGENLRRRRPCRPRRGSSPLTRGKPLAKYLATFSAGLIPAHAGKTVGLPRVRESVPAHPRSRGENRKAPEVARRKRAHPRSRGENSARQPPSQSSTGSSPLTRGKLHKGVKASGNTRLIPAHAGKTCFRRQTGRPCQAHPRSRGENWRHCLCLGFRGGSSPLTRGKLTRGLA